MKQNTINEACENLEHVGKSAKMSKKKNILKSKAILTMFQEVKAHNSISNKTKSASFWSSVTFDTFSPETIRKYWKEIRDMNDIEKFHQIVLEHKDVIDKCSLSLKAVINSISFYLSNSIELEFPEFLNIYINNGPHNILVKLDKNADALAEIHIENVNNNENGEEKLNTDDNGKNMPKLCDIKEGECVKENVNQPEENKEEISHNNLGLNDVDFDQYFIINPDDNSMEFLCKKRNPEK